MDKLDVQRKDGYDSKDGPTNEEQKIVDGFSGRSRSSAAYLVFQRDTIALDWLASSQKDRRVIC